tara:strand:- start:270 stop:665 length:396 start_codon:yes stop_codon:yes gene_type:complete
MSKKRGDKLREEWNIEEETIQLSKTINIREDLKEKIFPVIHDNREMAQFFMDNFKLHLSKYPFEDEKEVLEMATRFLNLTMDYVFADTILNDVDSWINNKEMKDSEQKLSILKSLLQTYKGENQEGMNVQH